MALIARDQHTIPPRGSTVVRAGDRLYVLAPHAEPGGARRRLQPLAPACLAPGRSSSAAPTSSAAASRLPRPRRRCAPASSGRATRAARCRSPTVARERSTRSWAPSPGALRTERVTGPDGRPVDAAWGLLERRQRRRRDGARERPRARRAQRPTGRHDVRHRRADRRSARQRVPQGDRRRRRLGDGRRGSRCPRRARLVAPRRRRRRRLRRRHHLPRRARPLRPAEGRRRRRTLPRSRCGCARLAGRLRATYGADVLELPGSGAAGGLAGGLAAAGARLVPGFDVVAEAVGFAHALAESAAAITGEGKVDSTTFGGKVVARVLERGPLAAPGRRGRRGVDRGGDRPGRRAGAVARGDGERGQLLRGALACGRRRRVARAGADRLLVRPGPHSTESRGSAATTCVRRTPPGTARAATMPMPSAVAITANDHV